jgi:alkylation response protein AidB-like acyl-CoA dehydrogenase
LQGDLFTFNQVVEAIAAADASPAWCLAQAAASSHAAGFLDPKVAYEVFGAPDALIAWGPPAGVAKAIVVDGGYRVTGKWRFASGSANATWMGGHSTVFETVKPPPYNSLVLSPVVICQHVSGAASPRRPGKNLLLSRRPVPIPVPIHSAPMFYFVYFSPPLIP